MTALFILLFFSFITRNSNCTLIKQKISWGFSTPSFAFNIGFNEIIGGTKLKLGGILADLSYFVIFIIAVSVNAHTC